MRVLMIAVLMLLVGAGQAMAGTAGSQYEGLYCENHRDWVDAVFWCKKDGKTVLEEKTVDWLYSQGWRIASSSAVMFNNFHRISIFIERPKK